MPPTISAADPGCAPSSARSSDVSEPGLYRIESGHRDLADCRAAGSRTPASGESGRGSPRAGDLDPVGGDPLGVLAGYRVTGLDPR